MKSRICIQCKKEYVPNLLGKYDDGFCSDDCFMTWEEGLESDNSIGKMRICQQCFCEFDFEFDDIDQQFCSLWCESEYQTEIDHENGEEE